MLPHLRRGVVPLALASLLAPTALAQDPPFHASLVGSYDDVSSVYGDIWGDGNFAYLARYGQSEIDIVDISNPASPSLATNWDILFPDDSASAQDVKTGVSVIGGHTLLFISLESGGTNGVQIVDVSDPYNPVHLTDVNAQPGPVNNLIHNTFYDQGWLYMSTSQDAQVTIVDLRSYDPTSAPASIGSWTYQVTGIGTVFVHDITVQNGLLMASAWDRLALYDVSNLASGPPVFLGQEYGMNTHSAWATDDGQFLVTAEERSGGGIRLYEIVDNGSSIQLLPRDSFMVSTADTLSTHNPLIVGDRIYASFYQAGGIVLQIDRTSKTLEKVASYDTSVASTGGFAGSWGIYPFLGADRVILSDIEEGFSVVDMSAQQIAFTAERPEIVPPLTPTTLTVEVTPVGDSTLSAGTVLLHTSVNGGPASSVVMSPIGGNQYQADLPTGLLGGQVAYWITAEDTDARVFASPADAPTHAHVAHVATGTQTIFFDNFDADLGWTVTNDPSLSTGAWTRGDPVGTGAQPERGAPQTAGVNCYFTGQGVTPTSVGEADIDGGPTILTSPVLDFSAGDGLISWYDWYFSSTGDQDEYVVEISNDDGSNWTEVRRLAEKAGGWVRTSFRVSDFVAPTGLVRVRFIGTDATNPSIHEVAIDEFRAERLLLAPAASAVARNGADTNPAGYSTVTLPVLGTSWDTHVDIATPGALASVLLVGTSGPAAVNLSVGELLIAPPLLKPNSISATGDHSIPILADPQFVGFVLYTQAATYKNGTITLNNAIDGTVGF